MNHTLQKQLSFQPTLHLIDGGELDNSWESGEQKIMKPLSANCVSNIMQGPWLPGRVKSLSSLEEVQPSSFFADDDCSEDENYNTFCEVLKKSPSKDGAFSSIMHTSFVSSNFSFAISGDDEEDSADEGNSEDDDDFFENYDCTFVDSNSCFDVHSGFGFNPFAVSGLFLPSLSAPILTTHTNLICTNNSDDDDLSEEDSILEMAPKLKDINQKWMEMYDCAESDTPNTGDSVAVDESEATKIQIKKKAVSFAVETTFISVLNETQWSDDYKEARKGSWHQFHIDGQRFAQRIESVRELLSKVLEAGHRERVYQKLAGSDNQDSITSNGETASVSDVISHCLSQ